MQTFAKPSPRTPASSSYKQSTQPSRNVSAPFSTKRICSQSTSPSVNGRSTPVLGKQSVACRVQSKPSVLRRVHAVAGSLDVEQKEFPLPDASPNRRPRVLIAGAGIGGLIAAVSLLKKGFDVQIFERDLTAIRGEGKYRGPIQIQSNALAALQAIDKELAERVYENGVITGDRINGLCDGVTGDWYIKFDTFHPAVEKGLPVTRVINRVTLQQILADTVMRFAGDNDNIIQGSSQVVDFEETMDEKTGEKRVWAILEDGRRYEGDLLIGADGIWSKIREAIWGQQDPNYSEYTCYTGISDFVPADIDTVGYRVFLGNGQYFVSSDVGSGKMQWYGFHREPAGGTDAEGQRKPRLREIFGHWSDSVVDLIEATPEDDILRRDIYDRPPIFQWVKGRVALLGDSAHAMQPNMGQGGCMAIEDGYQLAVDLGKAMEQGGGSAQNLDFDVALRNYTGNRVLRAAAVHGMAGMAAISASTYKAYLGEGLGPLSFIQQFKIPHPGKVCGQFILSFFMPPILDWILGGNVGALGSSEFTPYCAVTDKPKFFSLAEFDRFMRNDDELIRAARADWFIMPANSLDFGEGVELSTSGTTVIGRDEASGCDLVLSSPSVSPKHASIELRGPDYYVTDLGSVSGTFLNDRRISANVPRQLKPGDFLDFGSCPSASPFKIKMRHVSQRAGDAQEGRRSEGQRELAAVR